MLRPKFKCKLIVLSIWLTPFFHVAYANQYDVEQPSTSSCKEGFDLLGDLNRLNNQLGAAYLASNEALKQVYTIFGKRLSSVKSSEEISEISSYFLKSAKTLQEAENQNNQTILDLSLKAEKLRSKLSKCFQQTAVVAGLEPIKAEMAQIFDVYIPQNLKSNQETHIVVSGLMHSCGKWDRANVINATDFTHEISASTLVFNCTYPARFDRVTFQKEINLGKLAAGQHTLKISLGSDITFEVKP